MPPTSFFAGTGYAEIAYHGASFSAAHGARLDPASMRALLAREVVALVVPGYVSEHERSRMVEQFERRRIRAANGDLAVGASSFGAPLDAYLESAHDSHAAVEATAGELYRRIAGALERAVPGHTVRRSEHGGRFASAARVARWFPQADADGSMKIVVAHDDEAQLRDPLQQGWEAQRTEGWPIAFCAYPQLPEASTTLRFWNTCPSDEARSSLGLRYSGYAYPPSFLDAVPYLDVEVAEGSLVIFNGHVVHAVVSATAGWRRRLLVNFFAAKLRGENTLVTYT